MTECKGCEWQKAVMGMSFAKCGEHLPTTREGNKVEWFTPSRTYTLRDLMSYPHASI